MLLLGAKSITVEGVEVFPDHASPDMFWCLPSPVALERKGPDQDAAFTMIKYKPAAVAGGAKGGGFLMFEVGLRLDPELEGRILSRLAGIAKGTPILNIAQFDEGTVRCIALNIEGSGGTKATDAPPGAFNAVESILGASVPSLHGDNTAAFSLTLSQEGAIIMEQAFKQGTAPVGVVYDLKFTGIRPALDVKITADFKRIYQSFSASLTGQYYFFKLGIDAAFEKLVQDGAIKIEVTDFTTDQDAKDKEKWALDFFKDKLLTDWFEPTLHPGQLAAAPADASTLGSLPGGIPAGIPGVTPTPRPTQTPAGQVQPQPGQSAQPAQSTQPGQPQARAQSPTTPQSPPTIPQTQPTAPQSQPTPPQQQPTPPQPQPIPPQPAQPARPPAVMVIDNTTPTPLPPDRGMTYVPSAIGTQETLTVRGENPTVLVDGVARPLNPAGQFTVDVQPGSTHSIAVSYPSTTATTETFDLFFEFALPNATNWRTNPPSQGYTGYLNNAPTPDDIPFKGSTAPSGSSSFRGADALRDWVRNRLSTPKEVDIEAHASYEGLPQAVQYNTLLSVRRLDVAVGIIGNLATIHSTSTTGQTQAQAAGRVSTATHGQRNPDRIAKITGKVDGGSPGATINAHISRASAPTPTPTSTPIPTPTPTPTPRPTQPPTPTPTPTPAPRPTPTPTPARTQPPAPTSTPGSPEIALKLKFIRQEEQKTLTFEYHRADAVRRTYAPQGFFGLLLSDLQNKDKHFVEVDLDDPFFRVFTVSLDAPIDFRRIGLHSAQVALDYGAPGDEVNHKHGDFVFDAQHAEEKKFEVFMNADRDTSYRYSVQFHFDPSSDWEGERFSYEFPPKTTEDRTLLLNPFETIGFLEIQVFPNHMDAAVIESTDVHLTYQPPNGGSAQEKTINVFPGSAPQFWRLRLDNPTARDYSYRFVHHLKDGTVREQQSVTTRATALPVDDPFVRPLKVDFVPTFDPTTTRMVFIDIEYDDEANNYHREERLTLQGSAVDPVQFNISVIDPTQRTYRYRLTVVGTNNQMRRDAFVETTETLINVV